jgi:phage terminase small subunit
MANPLIKIARCAAADMVHFAGEFGMTPRAQLPLCSGPYQRAGKI